MIIKNCERKKNKLLILWCHRRWKGVVASVADGVSRVSGVAGEGCRRCAEFAVSREKVKKSWARKAVWWQGRNEREKSGNEVRVSGRYKKNHQTSRFFLIFLTNFFFFSNLHLSKRNFDISIHDFTFLDWDFFWIFLFCFIYLFYWSIWDF